MSLKRVTIFDVVVHLPAFALAWANVSFLWNHFYVYGAYLYDAGWFSGIVYRAGLFAKSPPAVAHDITYYWGWHPSIVVSIGSLLSYAYPGDRVDWYGIFQAAIYAPLGFAVPLLLPKDARKDALTAVLVVASSLALCFSGLVLANVAYPHFEIFSSAGTVLMLAALATGRERVAWAGLAMAIATREDGGMHAATFLSAVIACDFTKRPFPIARKRVLFMAATGVLASVVLTLVQKKLFVSADSWGTYFAGKPPFAHLTKSLLRERLVHFGSWSALVWVPLLGTMILTALRRDARYLFGWAVTIPWFVVNITAYYDFKGNFDCYTVFPFVGSVFWVAAYALANDRTRLGWRWPIALVGALFFGSYVGLYVDYPGSAIGVMRDAFTRGECNGDGLRSFARELRRGNLGVVRTDSAMASWALESQHYEDLVNYIENDQGVKTGDALAFFADPDAHALRPFALSSYRKCGRVPDTRAFFCTHEDRPLASSVVPSSPFVASMGIDPVHARRDRETVLLDPGLGLGMWGPFVRLPAGAYVASWKLRIEGCTATAPALYVDVVRAAGKLVAARPVAATDRDVELSFDVPADARDEGWELRSFYGACRVRIDDISVRRAP